MNLLTVAMIVVPVIILASSIFFAVKKLKKSKSTKKAFGVNLCVFGILILLIAAMSIPALASNPDGGTVTTMAAESTQPPAQTPNDDTATTQSGDSSTGLGLIAAALVVGLAAIGGGIAIAAAAPAAIGATSEDPKAFGKALIFVALGEAIALYGVIIAILILQKV